MRLHSAGDVVLHKPNGATIGSAGEEWPEAGRASLPYGLMSLWDMVNFSVLSLGQLCAGLRLETTHAKHLAYGRDEWPALGSAVLTEKYRKRMRQLLQVASAVASEFEWKSVADRVRRFERQIDDPQFNVSEWYIELVALKDAVEDGLKEHLVYRYPNDKAKILRNWKADWGTVLAKFLSAETDIQAAVDLWCLGHSTASVFHLMRVLEHGLRALAREVGKTFDTQQWQNIIDEINSAISAEKKTLPRGEERNERLQFLSEAAMEFAYFKDGWRNYVSHGRGVYDEHQARSVMEHVRAFMTILSSKLAEA